MKIDIHCHTSKYSSCSVQTPKEMVETAIKRGLDGIVITEHAILWDKKEIKELQEKYKDILILSGVEYSAKGYDILVYGIPEDCIIPENLGKKKEDFRLPGVSIAESMTPEEVIDYFEPMGCLFVLPHPFRFYKNMAIKEKTLRRFHAIETDSSNFDEEGRASAKKLAKSLNIPGITASDSHSTRTTGLWYIETREVKNSKDFIDILKNGEWKNHSPPSF